MEGFSNDNLLPIEFPTVERVAEIGKIGVTPIANIFPYWRKWSTFRPVLL